MSSLGIRVRFLCLLYRGALLAYPKAFRNEFGDQMKITFRSACIDAAAADRFPGFIWNYLSRSGVQLPSGTRLGGLLAGQCGRPRFAVCCGAFAIKVDWHNDEPQPAALVILVSTFVLAAARGQRPWLWAIILGTSIPAEYSLRLHEFHHFNWGSLVAFIPAAIGAYSGYGAGYLVRLAR